MNSLYNDFPSFPGSFLKFPPVFLRLTAQLPKYTTCSQILFCGFVPEGTQSKTAVFPISLSVSFKMFLCNMNGYHRFWSTLEFIVTWMDTSEHFAGVFFAFQFLCIKMFFYYLFIYFFGLLLSILIFKVFISICTFALKLVVFDCFFLPHHFIWGIGHNHYVGDSYPKKGYIEKGFTLSCAAKLEAPKKDLKPGCLHEWFL